MDEEEARAIMEKEMTLKPATQMPLSELAMVFGRSSDEYINERNRRYPSPKHETTGELEDVDSDDDSVADMVRKLEESESAASKIESLSLSELASKFGRDDERYLREYSRRVPNNDKKRDKIAVDEDEDMDEEEARAI